MNSRYTPDNRLLYFSLVFVGTPSYIKPMREVRELIEQGKHELFENRSDVSVHTFKEALCSCGDDDPMCMGEIFFFLGLAYRNLGHTQYALRCWENASFIRDKQDEINDKDWRVFHTIQTSRYLIGKGTGKFDTIAESDMIHDLIRMTWYEICDLEGLRKMSYYERCGYYRSIRISFPEITLRNMVENTPDSGQIVPFMKPKH